MSLECCLRAEWGLWCVAGIALPAWGWAPLEIFFLLSGLRLMTRLILLAALAAEDETVRMEEVT